MAIDAWKLDTIKVGIETFTLKRTIPSDTRYGAWRSAANRRISEKNSKKCSPSPRKRFPYSTRASSGSCNFRISFQIEKSRVGIRKIDGTSKRKIIICLFFFFFFFFVRSLLALVLLSLFFLIGTACPDMYTRTRTRTRTRIRTTTTTRKFARLCLRNAGR